MTPDDKELHKKVGTYTILKELDPTEAETYWLDNPEIHEFRFLKPHKLQTADIILITILATLTAALGFGIGIYL